MQGSTAQRICARARGWQQGQQRRHPGIARSAGRFAVLWSFQRIADGLGMGIAAPVCRKNACSPSGAGGPDRPQASNDAPRPTTRTTANVGFMVMRVDHEAASIAVLRLISNRPRPSGCWLVLTRDPEMRWVRDGDSSFMDAPMAWVGNPPSSPRPGHPGFYGVRGKSWPAGQNCTAKLLPPPYDQQGIPGTRRTS